MSTEGTKGTKGTKGKVAVLIEDHFDSTEYRMFNEYFPTQGYEVEYVSDLWGQPALHFTSNPNEGVIEENTTVSVDVRTRVPGDYEGILLIGAYAMDRLRYQVSPMKGEANQAPAVSFIRDAMAQNVKVGTICHSLWLLCADKKLLEGRRVTCAHNIVCDVENAGADVVFDEEGTAELVVDGNLISAKHPEATQRFMEVFVKEMES
jgi:protease I